MNREKYGRAIAIVGLQFGSEGKGAVAQYLAYLASATVRIGASNAGHTVIYNGVPYVMRQIPCGWINPCTKLVIGISAIISLPVLLNEIAVIEKVMPIRHRLFIDGNAHVVTDDQITREATSGLAERISSTSAKGGLGIGIAMTDKIMRSAECRMAKDIPELAPYIADTVTLLNEELLMDEVVIFEGTQGFELSIEHGKFPFTTSRDTTAQSLFAGTGVNPYGFTIDTIGVARAYPIRVGGNSGPFNEDSEEITWEEVARRAGFTTDITERTSVTKSVRRVATFSWQGLEHACLVNQPTEIALTFADHLDASVYERNKLTSRVERFISRIETVANIPVGLVKTGPNMIIDRDWDRDRTIRKIAC